jgi:hypothetical protein
MKYVKMLGLAAIAAMAFTAFAASSASATVLCETTVTSGCGGTAWEWNTGAELEFSLKPGTSAKLTDPVFGFTIETCTASTVKGKFETHNPPGGTAHVTFSSCAGAGATEATDGTISIDQIAGTHNGTVTAHGFAVTLHDALGNMCSYAPPTDLGTFVPGASGTDGELVINKTVTLVAAHSDADCVSSGKWVATYTQTNKTHLYISGS